jgi:hypothetical protein
MLFGALFEYGPIGALTEEARKFALDRSVLRAFGE